MKEALLENNPFANVDVNQLIVKGSLSIIILAFGILLGKWLGKGLEKIFEKLEVQKHIRGGFLKLITITARWSIYLLFLNFAIQQLKIPALSEFFGGIILIVPAFTGAMILLSTGFVIAIYLREIIEDAEIDGWEFISQTVFYFIMYIFGVYAVKTALISFDNTTVNLIIIVLTAVISSFIGYSIIKEKK